MSLLFHYVTLCNLIFLLNLKYSVDELRLRYRDFLALLRLWVSLGPCGSAVTTVSRDYSVRSVAHGLYGPERCKSLLTSSSPLQDGRAEPRRLIACALNKNPPPPIFNHVMKYEGYGSQCTV
jgi:hypothetical protein